MNNEENVFDEIIEKDPGIYEASFLFVPSLTTEAVASETDAFKAKITSLGGTLLHAGEARSMPLAYPMSRVANHKKTTFTNAFFGWVKFEFLSKDIGAVRAYLKDNEHIIRSLVIKTIKEAPMTIRRIPPRHSIKKPEVIKEEPQKVDEAQLEKEIEGLLVS